MRNQRLIIVSTLIITLLTFCLTVSAAQIIGSNFASTNDLQVTQLAGLHERADPPVSEIPVPQNSSEPLAINVDSSGNVWFAESYTHVLVEYFPTNGTFRDFAIPTPQHTGLIWFIIFDKAGDIWFSDASQQLLWRFSPATGQFANFTTGQELVDPYALAYEPSSNQIWFTSTYTGQIGVFQIEPNESASMQALISVPAPNGEIQSTSGNSEELIGPSGLSLDAQGNVYVSEAFASAIAEYSPSSSTFVRIWKLPEYAQPVGVAVDEARGLVWFSDHATSYFGYVEESSGKVVEISSSLSKTSSGGYSDTITLPYWISVGPQGMIWFDEHYGNKIARYNPSTMQLTEFLVPTSSSSPLRFALDNTRGLVWFTEFSGNNIGVLSQNSSLSTLVSLSSYSTNLESSSNSFDLTANYQGATGEIFSPLVSGTFTIDGDLSSNLTISSNGLNTTAYGLTFARGSSINAGNYTLTICPRLSSADSGANPPAVRQCAVAFLTVNSSEAFFLGLTETETYVLAAVVIVVIAIISLIYVRRWKGA